MAQTKTARRTARLLQCAEYARLALRELERAPRLCPAVLLAFDHARIAGQESATLQRAAQFRLEIGQGLSKAVTHGSGLAGKAAAGDRAGDVILPAAIGRDQRLLDQHAQHGPREEHFHRFGVDEDLARAGLYP